MLSSPAKAGEPIFKRPSWRNRDTASTPATRGIAAQSGRASLFWKLSVPSRGEGVGDRGANIGHRKRLGNDVMGDGAQV